MHEDDRVHLITLSGTQGGDNTPILMDVYSGAVQDIATNINLDNFGVLVEEIADTTRPLFLAVKSIITMGCLRINASETIDTTPRHFVRFIQVFLTRKHPTGKSEGDHVDGGNVQLLASTVISNDTVTLLSIRLSEPERVAAISYSGTPGGDDISHPTELDVEVGGFRDIATNLNNVLIGMQLREIADTTQPFILSATLRLTDGILKLTLSETIRSSTVLFGNIALNNVSKNTEIALVGASVGSSNLPTITIELIETMRARAIEISGTPWRRQWCIYLEYICGSDEGYGRQWYCCGRDKYC